MSVSTDIFRSWRAPGDVVRDIAHAPKREGRALSFLILGCLLMFVANGPRLARSVGLGMQGADGSDADLYQAMTYSLFAWLVIAPLLFYVIAMIVHFIRSAITRAGDGYDTRLAVFWALLAASPAALLNGLVAGMIGPGIATQITGAIWLAGFVWIAYQGLRVVSERATA